MKPTAASGDAHKNKEFTETNPEMKTMKTLALLAALALASCGGTFTLRPDGSIGYTTPEILKAPIVYQK